ncbi:helix-turn-helix domain-containing protein [Nonomuraea glycinis]|uniref:helix-turn-helix domain-containing protein n=1 Tax=Nonomuraea glycinis TaxID=2047744 RepID=UPI00389ADAA1
MRVVQAYRFALDPTARQGAVLASHCGAVRVAFNWGLAQVRANLAQREAERSCGIPEDRLPRPCRGRCTACVKAGIRSRTRWRRGGRATPRRPTPAGWPAWPTPWRTGVTPGRARVKGPKVGFPRFKTKRRAARSVRFTTGTIRLDGHCPDQTRTFAHTGRITDHP